MSAESKVAVRDHSKEPTRVEAFSDGVFAIAMTLLVLNLKVPTEADIKGGNYSSLAEYMLNQWPVYGAYIFSFVTVLLMWIAHHNFFNYVAEMDTGLMLYNGFQLMGITVVPFTTALLAQWATDGKENGLVAAIYSGNLAFITFLVFLQFVYAAGRKGLLRSDLRPGLVEAIRLRNLIGPSFYTIATLLGIFYTAWACMLVCGILLLYYTVLILVLARRWLEG